MRTWPLRDRRPYKGVDIKVWGWQPIPEGQRTLMEILNEEGYRTLFGTDTLHHFKASMNFQRGFDVFDFLRGQTTDEYKPIWTYLPEKLDQAMLLTGESGILTAPNER
jgi:arylsulfatase A-like enzyme